MKNLILSIIFLLVSCSLTHAAAIQYIGNGKGEPVVKISYSRNNGAHWENKTIKPGQTFQIPKDATHLKIGNEAFKPDKNYKIKDGHVF